MYSRDSFRSQDLQDQVYDVVFYLPGLSLQVGGVITVAEILNQLVKAGKKIGVTAVGHETIRNVLRAVCERYDLPYSSGRLGRQYLSASKRILRFALPGRGAPALAGSRAG